MNHHTTLGWRVARAAILIAYLTAVIATLWLIPPMLTVAIVAALVGVCFIAERNL